MSRPNIYKLDSWSRHEARVLEIFEGALRRLEREPDLPMREDDLNRRLLQHARQENYRLGRIGRGSQSNIYYEANNQPSMEDADRSRREDKRPDFTCGLVDSKAGLDLFFVIEGKRLGKPTSPGWILTRNYVANGVQRFMNSDWSYGMDTVSGAMIAYIQTIRPAVALREVNASSKAARIPELAPATRAVGSPLLSFFEHNLARAFQGSPFKLCHVWLDLTHKCTGRVKKPRKVA